MTSQDAIATAAARADAIAARIASTGGNLATVFESAERIATEYQDAAGDLEQVLPATDEVGQGFLMGKIPSGRAIVRAFADALSEDLCNPKADLHKRIMTAANIGSATLIGWLLAALGLSVGAATLLAPIAGAIIALGLPAFCTAAREA